MLGELTPRSKDKIASFGEYLSSKIIAHAFLQQEFNATWKDSRELISTNSNFNNAAVDFEKQISK